MKFNTKTRYGIRTMLEIAIKENKEGVFQKEISEKQAISFKYLDQIISALKTAGLIINVKGKKSGYKLTRKPSQITTYDIIKAFEPDIYIVDCLSDFIKCKKETTCAAKYFWEGLNNQITGYLKNYTLQELLDDHVNLNNEEE